MNDVAREKLIELIAKRKVEKMSKEDKDKTLTEMWTFIFHSKTDEQLYEEVESGE